MGNSRAKTGEFGSRHLYPLGSDALLSALGGKGHSLARLTREGYPVPEGFHIGTSAFQLFMAHNDLKPQLEELAKPQVINGRLSFERAARQIREVLNTAALPAELADAILRAWDNLGSPAVAIRSSATAEDMPEHSFAGLQDTYLNVGRSQEILEAVKGCWTSLWNARALSYRHERGIESDKTTMAVLVQRMLNPDVSGVLFTANPLTGNRNEIVVNATYGLGTQVVSGEITPDSFVIDRKTSAILSTTVGDKQFTQVAGTNSGLRTLVTEARLQNAVSISEVELKSLVAMCLAIQEDRKGIPQDIEWLFAAGKAWVLQSRPITNLPPPPLVDIRWDPPEPSAFLGRSQLVEHIPGPVSTLFEDLHMTRSLQRFWGMNLVRRGNHTFEDTQPPASFVVQTTVNGYAYRQLGEPPRSGSLPSKRSSPSNPFYAALRRCISYIRKQCRVFRMWFLWVAEWRLITLPRYLRVIARWNQLDPSIATTEQLWAGIRALSLADARYWYRGGAWNVFSMTRGTEYALDRFLQEHGQGQISTGLLLSGMASPAFEANLSLWRIAEIVRKNSGLLADLLRVPPSLWFDRLLEHPRGTEAASMLNTYLREHGHRVFTLDFVEPPECEATEQLGRTLQSLVLASEYNPHSVQTSLNARRAEMLRNARKTFRGKQRWKFEWLHWRARHFYPNREAAFSHLGRAWTVLRPFAFELGRRLAARSTLNEPSDIYYLTVDELGRAIRSVLVNDGLPELKTLAQQRQLLRESRKRLNPPIHIGKPPFWLRDRIVADDQERSFQQMLEGSAVSPGKVTAPASLILSTGDFERMQPNTILVCPATTPAWTQLFPQAIGLVTDIGGILAHGSIVAREYGIPAVLGIPDATKTISDGQVITVDGDKGTVTLC